MAQISDDIPKRRIVNPTEIPNPLPISSDTPLDVNVSADEPLDVALASGSSVGLASPLTGFGELNTAGNRPFIQATAVYGTLPSNFRDYTSGSGATDVSGGLFEVSTGTTVYSYGTIQSFRSVNYKAGEGGLARFTSLFTSPVANSWQGAGLFTIGDELSFGYNGVDFGVFHRNGGKAEVRTVQVTLDSANEDLTLTLNSVAYTIPLTTGTVQHNAFEIETWLNANQSVWHAEQLDDSVKLTALSDSPKSGTYTFSASTATGTITQVMAGVAKTTNHITVDSWNGTHHDDFDPTFGNVYQIRYQYLGFGAIFFDIEDPTTGQFVTAHTIRYANANSVPSLGNPSLHLGIYAVSIGSTTDLTVKSASMAAFVQGQEGKTRNPRAYENSQSLNSSDFTNILSIRNSRSYNGFVNQQEVSPEVLTIANDASKNLEIEVRENATPTGDTNYQSVGTNLIVDADTSSVPMTGGTLIISTTLSSKGNISIDLNKLRIRLPPTTRLSVAGKLYGGSAADVTASLVWYEDL